MTSFLQKISDSIPAPSNRVRASFQKATSPDPLFCGTLARYIFLYKAVCCSFTNGVVYGLTPPYRILGACIYESKNLRQQCFQDVKDALNSLYVAAALAAYLFFHTFKASSFPLTLVAAPSSNPAPPPPTENKASVGQSEEETPSSMGYVHPPSDNPDPSLLSSHGNQSTSLNDKEAQPSLIQSYYGQNLSPLPSKSVPPALPPPSSPKPVSLYSPSVWTQLLGKNTSEKAMKYHLIFNQLRTYAEKNPPPVDASAWGLLYQQSVEKCRFLHTIIQQSKEDPNIRQRYRQFVTTLREACSFVEKCGYPQPKMWVRGLCLQRFAGIELFSYCKFLVEYSTGPFDSSITLDNFEEELKKRNHHIDQKAQKDSVLPRLKDRLSGHLNTKDFLAGSNIPYLYGVIEMKGKTITVLRHGTPIQDFSGLPRLTWMPWAQLGSPPVVTSDYDKGFIEAANQAKKKILHIILENGISKTWIKGDESQRVHARLALGDLHPNFFPVALRLDGPFVEPQVFQTLSIQALQEKFVEEMFGNTSGYHVHYIMKAHPQFTTTVFRKIMDQVINAFFFDSTELTTLEDYQSFILFTYAQMILYLCDTLDIHYLEVLCKDDVDRGGAMKAIITLLHLYKCGMFDQGKEDQLSQALQNVMVNLIAAPLIVRKNAILEHRGSYVIHCLNLLKKIVKKRPSPSETYKGEFKVLNGPTPEASSSKSEVV